MADTLGSDGRGAGAAPPCDPCGTVELVHELAEALAQAFDVQTIGSKVVDRAVEVVGAEGGFLLRLGRAVPELAYRTGTTPEALLLELARGRGPLAQGEAARGLLVSPAEGAAPLLLVPARLAGEAFGVLGLAGKRDGGRFTPDDVRLIHTLGTQLAAAFQTERLLRELRHGERLQAELEAARQLQRSLLPAAGPRILGVDIVATCHPAGHVGGDYFDFFSFGNGRFGLVIADVSGHGVGSAIVMAGFRAMLHSESHPGFRPGNVLEVINERLVRDLGESGMFISAFLATYDAATSEMAYSNAGHPPPLVLDPVTDEVRKLEAGGTLLGLFPNTRYEEGRCVLGPGTVLVLYTDGLTEARGPSGEMFREERLAKMLLKGRTLGSAELHAKILRRVTRHVEGRDLHDDVTLIVTSRVAEGLGSGPARVGYAPGKSLASPEPTPAG